jgi:hypothetical protein
MQTRLKPFFTRLTLLEINGLSRVLLKMHSSKMRQFSFCLFFATDNYKGKSTSYVIKQFKYTFSTYKLSDICAHHITDTAMICSRSDKIIPSITYL